MNEFRFYCKVCGRLSDDGDILNRICMGCDDAKSKVEKRRGVGEFQKKQIAKTELTLLLIKKYKQETPTIKSRDIAEILGLSAGYVRRLIKRLNIK